MRVPFVLYAPNARATDAVWRLAARLGGFEREQTASDGRRGFIGRLVSWLGMSERTEYGALCGSAQP